MGKEGKVNRSKHANTRFLDAREKQKFKFVGWYKFVQKFYGENVALAQAFAKSFNGKKVRLGSKTFNISEDIIARETQPLTTSEH